MNGEHSEDQNRQPRAAVFAGTTEGCALAGFLASNGISVCASTATDYGAGSLPENENLEVFSGRMNAGDIRAFLLKQAPDLVIDATHPYAAEATKNIRLACLAAGTEYIRVIRGSIRKQAQSAEKDARFVYVESMAQAAAWLKNTTGNILVTTGSKELREFTMLPDYRERVYARVLSLPDVVKTCTDMGFEGRHLTAMQGPFSRELNEAMLRQFDCRYLVTKDTGRAGGFEEKTDAALACGAVCIVIGRPPEPEGLSFMEAKAFLIRRFRLNIRPVVTLMGIGMGSEDTLTAEVRRAAEKTELIIGAARMVKALRFSAADTFEEYRCEEITAFLRAHPEYERVAVALSGDPGFYSGARKLHAALSEMGAKVEVLCGISSASYFMSKIGLSWDDAELVSLHGRSRSLILAAAYHPKVFAILGEENAVSSLASGLVEMGLGEAWMYVGERLSYPDERILRARAKELVNTESDPLCVVCICNPAAGTRWATHGLPDESFVRGKIPMTKEEVRSVSLSRLRLRRESICYDVGAGTGSVSVEMALRCDRGAVYAIEEKEEALSLIEANRRKFSAENLVTVAGTAPEAMACLPAPTHAFIGGSSGKLRAIMRALFEKNPDVRIVINCITLETVSEALHILQDFEGIRSEIVTVTVARSRTAGRYHMMMGENPVYIISCQSEDAEDPPKGARFP